MYSFGPDGDERFVVNGREYGPFQSVLGMSCSPDGKRWVANYLSLDDQRHYGLTDSGRFGPYDDPVIGGVTFSIGAAFQGNEWAWAGILPDKKMTLLIDGKSYGPYTRVVYPLPPSSRSTEKRWAAYAVADDRVDIFVTGKLHASVKPFEPIGRVHAGNAHWHMLGRATAYCRLLKTDISRRSAPSNASSENRNQATEPRSP